MFFICFHIMSDWEVNDHLRLSLTNLVTLYLVPTACEGCGWCLFVWKVDEGILMIPGGANAYSMV